MSSGHNSDWSDGGYEPGANSLEEMSPRSRRIAERYMLPIPKNTHISEEVMTFAIVQHSAAGYNQDPQFTHGLETRRVNAKQANRVTQLGGKIFATYTEAEDYCDTESYPTGTGLIPNAAGTFVREGIDGLRIYIPREA